MDYDDFYSEPSEFEQQIDEFKQSLINAVKEEYQGEMKRLREENSKLQEYKKDKDRIEREHQQALQRMRNDQQEYERRVKRMRLAELLGENFTVAWGTKDDYEELPKCDKGDKDRRIHFNSPSGKSLTEDCECKQKKHNFVPQELSLIRFYIMNEKYTGRDEHIERHYRKVAKIESDYDEYTDTTSVYNGEEFSKVNSYGIVFLSKEKCKEYCDWLNLHKESR